MSDLLFNGDLAINEYGDISVCADENDDILQTANNNILMKYGSNIFHPDLGNMIYQSRVKSVESGREDVITECKNAILNGDIRVKDVQSISVQPDTDSTTNSIVTYILLLQDDTILDGRSSLQIL